MPECRNYRHSKYRITQIRPVFVELEAATNPWTGGLGGGRKVPIISTTPAGYLTSGGVGFGGVAGGGDGCGRSSFVTFQYSEWYVPGPQILSNR